MIRKEARALIDALSSRRFAEAKRIVKNTTDLEAFAIVEMAAIKMSHKNKAKRARLERLADKIRKERCAVRRGRQTTPVRFINLLAKI